MIKAVEFRFKKKKERLSLTDCVGYILALKNKIKFLTGDLKFKDMKGVEFER